MNNQLNSKTEVNAIQKRNKKFGFWGIGIFIALFIGSNLPTVAPQPSSVICFIGVLFGIAGVIFLLKNRKIEKGNQA